MSIRYAKGRTKAIMIMAAAMTERTRECSEVASLIISAEKRLNYDR